MADAGKARNQTLVSLKLNRLMDRLAEIDSANFRGNDPFPHIVLDDAVAEHVVDKVHQSLWDQPDHTWDKSNDVGIEVKWRSNWRSEYDIPEPARELVQFFNSGLFLRELSRLTGISHLIPDPYYTGGGLNLIKNGGYLDVHVDGNWHDAMAVHRRLNLILYLNRHWKADWGGALGFYSENGNDLIREYEPYGNRLVVFETHDKSFHGHPNPISCPDDQSRTSIILYYYTAAPRPVEQVVVEKPHSALWRSKDWTDKRGNKSRV